MTRWECVVYLIRKGDDTTVKVEASNDFGSYRYAVDYGVEHIQEDEPDHEFRAFRIREQDGDSK